MAVGSNETVERGELSTSRRALLKGAVAAGVGAAVYASPIVSTVPAYATHGLSTWTVQSSDICFGFSPNHEGSYGDWHLPSAVANVFDPINWTNGTNHSGHGTQNRSDVEIKVRVMVGGSFRRMSVSGHFNNWGGSSNPTEFDVVGWNGGGIRMRLLDPACEMVIQGWYSGTRSAAQNCTETMNRSMRSSFSPIHSANINPGTAPANTVPNPWQGDPTRTIYYHSGQPRKGGTWVSGVRFRIRCES